MASEETPGKHARPFAGLAKPAGAFSLVAALAASAEAAQAQEPVPVDDPASAEADACPPEGTVPVEQIPPGCDVPAPAEPADPPEPAVEPPAPETPAPTAEVAAAPQPAEPAPTVEGSGATVEDAPRHPDGGHGNGHDGDGDGHPGGGHGDHDGHGNGGPNGNGSGSDPDGDGRGQDGHSGGTPARGGPNRDDNGNGSGHATDDAAAAPGAELGVFAPGGSADIGPVPVVTGDSPIPSFLLPVYQECGERYGVPWRVLAAINEVETAFGTNLNVSSAGAQGWMQFMPATWATYGVDADGDGDRNPNDPDDAICAAANYLDASGASHDLRGAIFAYNHADWYVEMVMSLASSYAGISVTDPLPPAARLDRDFAIELAQVARSRDVDWALLLAVVRINGGEGSSPATADELRKTAKTVARGRGLGGEVSQLGAYNRAIGLRGLVHGLNAVRDQLAERVLDNPRLDIYDGGRSDIEAGRIDSRLLALLLFLGEEHDEITVSCLISGHGYYARPGVPSAHIFGEAVDISAVDGTPVVGNQQAGSVVEQTLREILALPTELQPEQLISLYDLGGPSFAQADHDDHIHVGF